MQSRSSLLKTVVCHPPGTKSVEQTMKTKSDLWYLSFSITESTLLWANANPKSLKTTSRFYQLHSFAYRPNLNLFQLNYWQMQNCWYWPSSGGMSPIKRPCSLWVLTTAMMKAALCNQVRKCKSFLELGCQGRSMWNRRTCIHGGEAGSMMSLIQLYFWGCRMFHYYVIFLLSLNIHYSSNRYDLMK